MPWLNSEGNCLDFGSAQKGQTQSASMPESPQKTDSVSEYSKTDSSVTIERAPPIDIMERSRKRSISRSESIGRISNSRSKTSNLVSLTPVNFLNCFELMSAHDTENVVNQQKFVKEEVEDVEVIEKKFLLRPSQEKFFQSNEKKVLITASPSYRNRVILTGGSRSSQQVQRIRSSPSYRLAETEMTNIAQNSKQNFEENFQGKKSKFVHERASPTAMPVRFFTPSEVAMMDLSSSLKKIQEKESKLEKEIFLMKEFQESQKKELSQHNPKVTMMDKEVDVADFPKIKKLDKFVQLSPSKEVITLDKCSSPVKQMSLAMDMENCKENGQNLKKKSIYTIYEELKNSRKSIDSVGEQLTILKLQMDDIWKSVENWVKHRPRKKLKVKEGQSGQGPLRQRKMSSNKKVKALYLSSSKNLSVAKKSKIVRDFFC